jgi:hypothetical protein
VDPQAQGFRESIRVMDRIWRLRAEICIFVYSTRRGEKTGVSSLSTSRARNMVPMCKLKFIFTLSVVVHVRACSTMLPLYVDTPGILDKNGLARMALAVPRGGGIVRSRSSGCRSPWLSLDGNV